MMKKNFNNKMIVGLVIFASLSTLSNISCTGQASNNEENKKASFNKNAPLTENDGAVVAITESTFDEKIKSGLVIVDFFATWCKPCKMESPIIEETGKELAGKSSVYKLDIDKNPSIANRYNVQSIPTIIIFKEGKAVGQFVGLTQKEDILSEVEKFSKSK